MDVHSESLIVLMKTSWKQRFKFERTVLVRLTPNTAPCLRFVRQVEEANLKGEIKW